VVGGKLPEARRNLGALSRTVHAFLRDEERLQRVRSVAATFATEQHLFLLGKGQNMQIIKEGMVKIIEGAYIHAHGIPAGDLKHYAITLMQPGTPVLAVVSNDDLRSDVLNAVHEVKARGAAVVGVSPVEDPQFDDWISVPDTKETSAIMNVIPLQLLAYFMALARGNNVDKPRNIAKSVTVK
jgi:glucosamine--fructose-6-phosphate aminotransferase (isomerizing)